MHESQFKRILKLQDFDEYNDSLIPTVRLSRDGDALVIKGDFDVDDITFNSGERYEHEIIIDGGTFKKIIFKGGYFKKIYFRNGTFNGFVSIRGGIIDDLVFLGGTFHYWMGTLDGFANPNTPGSADEPLVIKRFQIEGATFTNNIWIAGGKILLLEIKTVSAMKIHCKPNDDLYLDNTDNTYKNRYVSSPEILNLTLSRYSNKDNFIHISNIDVDRLKFEDFTNIGNITISRINLRKELIIQNSDLGKTTFMDCDFKKQNLRFSSSKITEVALAGCDLPDPANITLPEKVPPAEAGFQKRLALSQIKKVYQNMGDSVKATDYQAHELITYHGLLRGNKNPGERLSLWLNGKTNRHGRSWSRAFWVLIIGSGIFYIFYCISLGFWWDLSAKGLKVFFINLANFPEFLNPIRKSDFLPKVLANKNETQVLGITYFIDSLAKIFTAYLVYQLIAAFRKHGKKE